MESDCNFNVSPSSSSFLLSDELFKNFFPIRAELISPKFHRKDEIWEASNFLFPEECEKLINFCENLGFSNSRIMLPTENNKLLRNIDRILLSDAQTASFLSNILVNFVPLAFEGGIFDGASKNLKFYKYEKDMHYGLHIDGESEDKERKTKSVASIIIYLNSVEKGGVTRFVEDHDEQVIIFLGFFFFF
jgi:hypothetical protein